jgi:hypothetical protein
MVYARSVEKISDRVYASLMTSILTAACPRYVVQVSDRRLSKVAGKNVSEHDASSNKTIVFRCSDAIVSIGYSGVGYIRGIPTDEWLAECLSGGTPIRRGHDRSGPVGLTIKAKPFKRDIGFALREVCASIDACAEVHVQQHGLYITVAGWQQSRRGYRPIVVEIGRPPGQKCSISQEARVWPRGTEFRTFAIGAQIDSAAFKGRFAPFRGANGRLRINSDQVERVLADIVEQISRNDVTVGPDVMSVVLKRPDLGGGYSHFITPQPHQIGIESGGTSSNIAVAYSPWIIGPRSISAPSLEVGNSMHSLDGFEFEVIGAPSTGSTVILKKSLHRPPPP